MIAVALKHFVIVGVCFAFLLAWFLTLVVNSALGWLLEAASGGPPTSRYWCSLLLTAVSIALIGCAAHLGNVAFRKTGGVMSIWAALVSTSLFAIIPLFVAGPEILAIIDNITRHMSYYSHHSKEALMELSLPMLRMALIPSLYFIVAVRFLRKETGSYAK